MNILANLENFLQSIGSELLGFEEYLNSLYSEFYSAYPSITKCALTFLAIGIASIPFIGASISTIRKVKNDER